MTRKLSIALFGALALALSALSAKADVGVITYIDPSWTDPDTGTKYRVDFCDRRTDNCGQRAANSFCWRNATGEQVYGWQASAFKKAYNVGPTYIQSDHEIRDLPNASGFEFIECVNTTVIDPVPTFGGMRVDNCKTFGKDCGWEAANLYCNTVHDPASLWWANPLPLKIEPASPTYVLGDGKTCTGSFCAALANVHCVEVADKIDPPTVDIDDDLIADFEDNCPFVGNFFQYNQDGDSRGDACDPGIYVAEPCDDGKDNDGDGFVDLADPQCQGSLDGSESGGSPPVDPGDPGDPVDPGDPAPEGMTPVAVQKLRLKEMASDPSRSRVVWKSQDGGVAPTSEASPADPARAGATLRIVNPTSGEEGVVALAPEGWARTKTGTLRYRDDRCKVAMKPSGKLAVRCLGTLGGFHLDEVRQGTLELQLRLGSGDAGYCARSGQAVKDFGIDSSPTGTKGVYGAADAPAPPSCTR